MKTGNIVNLGILEGKFLQMYQATDCIQLRRNRSHLDWKLKSNGEVCERGSWFIRAVSQPVDSLGWIILCCE